MSVRLAAVFLCALLVPLGAQAREPAELPRDKQWAFERSDIAVDPGFRFGRLANGMRYIVRRNATPAGTALVRMDVATG